MGGTGDADGVLFEGFPDGSYDCVDRVVLRAYFQLGRRAPGFRMWWRCWQGSDDGLNNTRLMRVAGRFARRVKGWAKGAGVPLVYGKTGDRNEDLARGHAPDDLRKFRCKGLAARIPRSRRYLADPSALRAMAALLLLRDKVVRPLLAAASTSRRAPGPPITSALDQRYAAVHHEMRSLFDTVGIAA